MHPFPVVTQLSWNVLQSASVEVEVRASEHNFTVQLVPELNLHFPSFPLINKQDVSVPVNPEQLGNLGATHPA
jgi:hypothetical protein